MRVLIVTQHYAPEITAGRVRLETFTEGLVEAGHEVEVICAVPNHPSGQIADEFRGRALVRRRCDDLAVRYVWVRARPEKTTRNRLLLYGTFAAAATIAGIGTKRPDVVFASSPPLTVGAAGAAIAAARRVPLVFDVRDLWPETAVMVGELTDERIVKWATRLEKTLYRRAAAVTTTTEAFRRRIVQRGGTSERSVVIPNGTTQLFLDAGEREYDRRALGMPANSFVWTYAGNLGLTQGLEAAIAAAGVLGEEFQLQLVGEGPRRNHLEEVAAGLPAGWVRFRGLVEPEVAAGLMRASDALLVSLQPGPPLDWSVPSKVYDSCAIGRPVVMAATGEPARVTSESNAALQVPPGNVEAIVAAVRSLRENKDLGRTLSDSARRFAAENVRSRHLERLTEVLSIAADGDLPG